MLIGSVNTQVKQSFLKFKAENNLKGKQADTDKSEISRFSAQMKDMSESNKLAAIINKMRMGKRLNAAEKAHLKKSSPDLYAKYKRIEAERDSHGRSLDRAKSKKDAARIHNTKIIHMVDDHRGAAAGAAQEDNMYRAAAIQDEYREYQSKGKSRHKEDTVSKGRMDAAKTAYKKVMLGAIKGESKKG